MRGWGRRLLLGLAGLLIVLVLAGGGVWLVGRSLPEHHTATVSRVVDAPAERVWTTMTAVESFPTWREEVDRVERLPDRDGLPVWRESGRYGAMTLQVTRLDPPRRMVTRIADEDLPFGGTWTYELQPVDGGRTRVTLTEDGTVSDPFFRFMARYVFGHAGTMETYLGGLERQVGEAERPATEGSSYGEPPTGESGVAPVGRTETP